MKGKGFNLLKPQLEPPTVWTKIYDWIVGTARLVVIIVELIVVVAFGIRLFVDIQERQLDDDIATKESIIRALQESETRYIKIQSKTGAFRDGWEETPVYTDVYAEINNYLPVDAVELSVQVQGDRVFASGRASVSEIGKMEASFKDSDTFKDTELVQLESKGSSSSELAEFSLRTNIREINYREVNPDNSNTET